jgi:hypothetical protein
LALSNAVLLHNHLSNSEDKTSVSEKEDIASKLMGKSKMEAKEILDGKSAEAPTGKPPKTKKPKQATRKITLDSETEQLLQELLALAAHPRRL